MPADWLGALRVEVDGVVRATGLYDAPWDGTSVVDVAAAYLQAFAAPVTVTTAFGQARVWVGGATSQEL